MESSQYFYVGLWLHGYGYSGYFAAFILLQSLREMNELIFQAVFRLFISIAELKHSQLFELRQSTNSKILRFAEF